MTTTERAELIVAEYVEMSGANIDLKDKSDVLCWVDLCQSNAEDKMYGDASMRADARQVAKALRVLAESL